MKSIKSIDQFPQSTVAFHVARELEASQSGSKFGKACRGSLEGFNDFGGYGDWRLGKFRRKTLCFVSLSLGMECVNQFRMTDVAQNNSASSNAKTLMRLESGMNDWTRAHTRAAIRASALLIVHLINLAKRSILAQLVDIEQTQCMQYFQEPQSCVASTQSSRKLYGSLDNV